MLELAFESFFFDLQLGGVTMNTMHAYTKLHSPWTIALGA